MNQKKQLQAQAKFEKFLSELRADFLSRWKFGDDPRVRFELEGCLDQLRKLGCSDLNDRDLGIFCRRIRENWMESFNQFELEWSAREAADQAELSKLREDIAQIEAQLAAFRSSPDVISTRIAGEKLTQQVATLNAQIQSARRRESLLAKLCDARGINITEEPKGI